MAKAQPNARRGRGRPTKQVQLDEKIMVRLDAATKAALDEYVRRTGIGAAAAAIRTIVTDKLRSQGLLK